jgi:hypothetical protein
MGTIRGTSSVTVVALTALALSWWPAQAGAQTMPNSAPASAEPPRTDLRPIVIGLGAIAGVVVFNVAALGVEALPGGFAYGAGAVVPAEMSVAMSRVYATTAAVVGGWVAYYGYGQ